MTANPVKVGIVGLGRWAKVLTRAARKSEEIKIVAAFSRSEEKRTAFEHDTGVPTVPDLQAMLADCGIEGAILTVPNEQHLPVAAEVAKAGKHVYTEKPIASTLEVDWKLPRWRKNMGSPSPWATAHDSWAASGKFVKPSAVANLAASPSWRPIFPTSERSS